MIMTLGTYRNILIKYVCVDTVIYTYVVRTYNSVATPMFEINVQFAQTILCNAQL